MLYAIPNLSSQTAFATKPWEFKAEVPAEAETSKAEFIKWCQNPTTKNCHFSAAEGLDPLRRVGGDNPVMTLHGLVADYDATCTTEMIMRTVTDSPTEFVPNYGSNTFSGNGRLVWLFEEPVTVANMAIATEFQKVVMRKLKLTKYLPGFDVEAFTDPCRYYDKGRIWYNLSNDPIPTNMVWQWMYEAGNKKKWLGNGDFMIPMDHVAKEVAKRFPGKWKGPFEDGARGCRFWDDMADNTTAAVVRATGMQCFTGDQGFVYWSEILGQSFVEKYKADTLGAIAAKYFFVPSGNHYWTKNEAGQWTFKSTENMRLELKVKHSLSSTTGKKEMSSDVDKALFAIQTQKEVVAAMPFIHNPSGMKVVDGERFLNIASVNCLAPSDEEVTEWGEGFPWIAEFLNGLFEPHEQLDYFLAWWKHFYQNGLKQKPRAGHALFIAGGTNVGKTLLSTGLISRTVGGYADASDYMLGNEDYTAHLAGKPLMAIDDTQGSADTRKHTVYSAMIKKVVANRYMKYARKYHDTGQVEWLGRVVVTLNLDPESVRMLPNCDISIMDKVMLLRCASRQPDFPEPAEMEEMLSRELPKFCRWMLNWHVPDQCKGDPRFGVKPYHDKHLYNTAIQTSSSYSFFELLADFLGQLDQGMEYYEGTSTQLIADMCLDQRIGALAAKYTPTQAASLLGQLKSRGFEFERVRSSSQRIWRIPLNVLERLEKLNNGES